jgi:hypothetical protein
LQELTSPFYCWLCQRLWVIKDNTQQPSCNECWLFSVRHDEIEFKTLLLCIQLTKMQ